jgi:aminoglycoside phosphotransferase (APT) family kinase protein
MARTRNTAPWSANFQRWLGEKLDAADVALSGFEVPAHGGMSHDTVLCDASWSQGGAPHEQRLVVRIEPSGPFVFPRYDLEAQCRVMRILGERTDVPVPPVLWSETSPDVLGRPFAVMERVEGPVPADDPPFLLKGWLHDAAPAEQSIAQQSVVEALARLHRLDWKALGLGFLDRGEFGAPGLDQEFGYWRHYLDWASQDRELPVLEAAFDWCAAKRPSDPGPLVLNWGDARIGNVIYGDDFRPAAILDWEMAMLGPAELDLGWFLFIHDTALMWLKELPGFRERSAVIDLYQERLGREVRDLRFFEAWAGLRAAAIRAQIVRRDFERGACEDLSQQERSPVVKSLQRVIGR